MDIVSSLVRKTKLIRVNTITSKFCNIKTNVYSAFSATVRKTNIVACPIFTCFLCLYQFLSISLYGHQALIGFCKHCINFIKLTTKKQSLNWYTWSKARCRRRRRPELSKKHRRSVMLVSNLGSSLLLVHLLLRMKESSHCTCLWNLDKCLVLKGKTALLSTFIWRRFQVQQRYCCDFFGRYCSDSATKGFHERWCWLPAQSCRIAQTQLGRKSNSNIQESFHRRPVQHSPRFSTQPLGSATTTSYTYS